VGENTGPGKYRLNDEAHAELLDKLAENKFAGATSEVRAELLHFFAEPDAPYARSTTLKPGRKFKPVATVEISNGHFCSCQFCAAVSA